MGNVKHKQEDAGNTDKRASQQVEEVLILLLGSVPHCHLLFNMVILLGAAG